jgi:BASS family bile acid:Na+ symporter
MRMWLWKFFRKFSLPCSLVLGAVGYLIFANVPFLEPLGDAVGPKLVDMMPVVLFALLYVTFCKIEIKEMKPKAWHFILQLIRTSLALMMVVLIFEFGDNYETKLVLEGAFICFICPTAAAVAVVTEKLGGSIGSLTTYTVIANVFTMVIIPSLFPMVEKGADVSFLFMSAMVFRNVTTVLVVPLLLALLSRKFLPKWVDKVRNVKDLGFYMWCFNLTILMGETVRNFLHAEVSGWILALLLLVPLLVCLIQFAIGKAVGRHYGDSISAGQALGQKNTVVGIWLTLTFLNPYAAIAPCAYVIWQNIINAWQLWYKQKYGYLRW